MNDRDLWRIHWVGASDIDREDLERLILGGVLNLVHAEDVAKLDRSSHVADLAGGYVAWADDE